jgi:hypothetical protein
MSEAVQLPEALAAQALLLALLRLGDSSAPTYTYICSMVCFYPDLCFHIKVT